MIFIAMIIYVLVHQYIDLAVSIDTLIATDV